MPHFLWDNMNDGDDVTRFTNAKAATRSIFVVPHGRAHVAHDASTTSAVVLLIATGKRRLADATGAYRGVQHSAFTDACVRWRCQQKLLIFMPRRNTAHV
jgi:hypothetical protein